MHGIDELDALLADADAVVLLTPLTDETHGLIGARALARMRDGALLVNAARGAVVDTDALVAETASGRLRAVLDVTDPEPLPDGHPLWEAEGVLSITPAYRRQLPPREPPLRGARRRPAGAILLRRAADQRRPGGPPDHEPDQVRNLDHLRRPRS